MDKAFIFQPHFKTSCFRVAVKDQQGIDYNYIIVCCSPEYNGVWRYKASYTKDYSIWNNGKLPCYEVPIDDCEKIKELKDLTNERIIDRIKKLQSEWCKNEVTNRNYSYKDKPHWLL